MKTALKFIGIAFLVLAAIGNIVRINHPSNPKVEDSFESQLRRANRDCPIPVANGAGQVTSMALEDVAGQKSMVYYIDYKPGYFSKEMFALNPESAKALFYLTFICVNAQRNAGTILLNEFVKRNIAVKVVINKGNESSFTTTLTPQYIKSMSEGTDVNPSEALFEALKLLLAMSNEVYPIKADDGMYLTKMILEGRNIVCYAECEDSIYDIDILANASEQLASELLQAGKTDTEICVLLDLCKVSHTGLCYRYVGKQSSKVADIVITSQDIRQYHKTPSQVTIQ